MKDINYFIGKYYVSEGCKPIEKLLQDHIEWIVLHEDKDSGKSLLISKDVLDWEFYDDADSIGDFNDSFVCSLLKEMYEEYFEEEEKDLICDTKYGKLFLLSLEEIEQYMPDTRSRRAVMKIVDYDSENKRMTIGIEHHFYWVRAEKGTPADEMPIIDSLGEVDYLSADADEVGVRPAMWVDTKKARRMNLKNGYNYWHHFWDYNDETLE